MTFTANEARRLAEEATALDGPASRAETEVCLAAIRSAAQRGERSTSMSIPFNHRSLIIRRLEHAGFTVSTYSDQRDGDWTTVSW